MKKKLYFTNAAPPWKSINALNTYVNFVYDTKTGELKLVDCFGGETKEVVVATIDKSGSEQGGEDDPTTDPTTDPTDPDTDPTDPTADPTDPTTDPTDPDQNPGG